MSCLAARRDLLGLHVQCLVRDVLAAHQATEPCDHRTRGSLPALDDTEPRDHCVLIAAPDAIAVDLATRHPQEEVRGAREQSHLTRLEGSKANHTDERIGTTCRRGAPLRIDNAPQWPLSEGALVPPWATGMPERRPR